MSKTKKVPDDMGFEIDDDDEGTPDEPVVLASVPVDGAASAAARARQDDRPVCPKHGGQMVSYSTSAMYTYYRCPAAKCHETAKRVRPIGPLKNKYGHGTSRRA